MLGLWNRIGYIIWNAGIEFVFVNVLILMLALWIRIIYIIWSAGICFEFVNAFALMLELCSNTGYIIWSACIGIDVGVVEHYRIHNMDCKYCVWSC